MNKLPLHTPDLTEHNYKALSSLFPNAITETINENGEVVRAIDADVLTQEINTRVVSGKEERYQFTWPDKKKAILLANSPIAATLRPCREESVNFDNTENLYIEGDNLDVLKLLRETYLNRIKMIYIDPPYNTGNDFVYNDEWQVDSKQWLGISGDYDDDGNRMVRNLDSNVRFHTDWLNMIYPRLRIAKDLLTNDGVIFISIGDGEVHNLRRICDEVFGEVNFIAEMVWQKKTGSSDAINIATITESIIMYSKSINSLKLNQDKEAYVEERYKYKDEYFEERGAFYYDNLDRGTLGYHESLDYPVQATDGTYIYPNGRSHQLNDGWRWKWSKEKLQWGINNGFIELRQNSTKSGQWGVYYKIYMHVDNDGKKIVRSSPFKNLLLGILNTHASNEAKEIFGRTGIFSNPKPIELIKRLIKIASGSNDIILDFFSGSSTTAHAVMQLNAEDSGKRKFIMVQLPEICPEDGEAAKAGYKNICEIGKERIRRAGQKIITASKVNDSLPFDQDRPPLDIGFRVLKLDSSNMKDVYYKPQETIAENGELQVDLDGLVDNIKHDRTPEDLLFQVMLDLGILLSSKIEKRQIGGKTVFSVADNNLIACFEHITDDTVTEIAKCKPYCAVFRDSNFDSDATLVNFEQIFKTYSPKTKKKVL